MKNKILRGPGFASTLSPHAAEKPLRVDSSPSADLAVRRRAERLAWELQQALPSLFSTTALSRLAGLAGEIGNLLAPVRSVELASLPNEGKVLIVGDRLQIDRTYPEQHCVPAPRARRRERFFLCVAHEVAHLAQGIGDKQHVQELHAADGEETLLQVDLEADHAAAVFVRALTGTSLVTLKQDSLGMLRAFPANIRHFPGAAQRKARRAVALAVDIAARNRGLVNTEDEFAFAHWTRGGGPAAVFARGPFTRRVKTFSVTPREAAILDSAANNPCSKKLLAMTDRILAQNGTIHGHPRHSTPGPAERK